MSEQLKILEMIQNGQITASEGMDLLDALKSSGDAMSQSLSSAASPKYKFRNYSVTHHKQPALPPRQTLLQRRDLRHA